MELDLIRRTDKSRQLLMNKERLHIREGNGTVLLTAFFPYGYEKYKGIINTKT